MKTTEFKKIIIEAKNVKWFNSVELSLIFPISNLNLKFKGLASLHKYAEEQILGWDKIENLPTELKPSRVFFASIVQELESFVNSYSSVEEDSSLDSYFRSPIANINNRNQKIFTYDSTETDFLLKVNNTFPKSFLGAYTYLSGNLDHNINNKDIFNGYLMGYEFKSTDSKLSQRIASEKASLQSLKTNFKNSLPELDKQLVDHLKDSSDKYQEYVTKIDHFQTDKEKTYSDWFINTKGEFETFDNASKSKIHELEETYKEKLKFEEPAKYWSDRGKDLKRQGWIALAVLVLLVLIVVWSLGEILWKTPEQIYSSFFNGDKSAAIRWSIVYITFISFMAFCIKAITKVMFSSFHLSRDCEERHTLTYFYLSLLKESNIDAEEKKLIIQSLFSRAETGLLKEDGSPTMPNDMVGKFYGR